MQTSDITIFLSGDVMTGRGIDQILPIPSDPEIYEGYIRNAQGYVKLAEEAHGRIEKPVSYDYIWGAALDELNRINPDARIINLETSVTTSDNYWKGKGINYRMHPDNVKCLTTAGIDCCVLANNHVLDWGYEGLEETRKTLKHAGIKNTGAGENLKKARTPAIIDVPGKGRIIVFAIGLPSSGIPHVWAATNEKAGVNFINKLSSKVIMDLRDLVRETKRKGDIVVASIHWGSNWGYEIRLHSNILPDKSSMKLMSILSTVTLPTISKGLKYIKISLSYTEQKISSMIMKVFPAMRISGVISPSCILWQ